MSSTHPKYAIGIDLGTSYCSVAVFENGRVKVVEDGQGSRRIPNYVAFTDDEYLVGYLARSQAAVNPSNTVYGVKRLLGRKCDDPELESDIKYWPFSVIEDEGRLTIQVEYKNETNQFCPEQITALVLTEMKEMAKSHFRKHKSSDVVISVPANFNNLQRKATIDAARIAGLNVLQLIDDSTAAALAYCTEKKITSNRNLMIFDLGGGSFDVSMVSIQNGKLDVKAVSGETHLGGEDFVTNMLRHITKVFQQNGNLDTTNIKSMARLKNACEVAKKELSKLPETRIHVEGCDYSHVLNAEIFNDYNKKLYTKMMGHVKNVLKESRIEKDNFNILLVGGCTRIPQVEEWLKSTFSGVQISKGINRDEAVAYGAAVQAALLQGDESEAIKHLSKIEEKPNMEIICDEDCISEEDIKKMKKRARNLKKDCDNHKERMQCRNNLEGYIISVQRESQNTYKNAVLMGKCDEILDWMHDNEKATKNEYESKQKELETLRRETPIAVPRSSGSCPKVSTQFNIPETDNDFMRNIAKHYNKNPKKEKKGFFNTISVRRSKRNRKKGRSQSYPQHVSNNDGSQSHFYEQAEKNRLRRNEQVQEHAANNQHETGKEQKNKKCIIL